MKVDPVVPDETVRLRFGLLPPYVKHIYFDDKSQMHVKKWPERRTNITNLLPLYQLNPFPGVGSYIHKKLYTFLVPNKI